jgi:hypothetical protein
MWPFNKQEESAPQVGRTEICIPGNWESYQQFRDAVITSTEGKYMLVGEMLMDVEE